jgi:hypothetical protein
MRALIFEIEMSAANLYLRLAERARSEGNSELAISLFKMATEERSQAQRVRPGTRTGPVKSRSDTWTHHKLGPHNWVRASSLGSRSEPIREYLGADIADQQWSEVLSKLGSAELLIAIWYLFTGDFKSFCEEARHVRHNGVRLRYLVKAIWLSLKLGLKGI